eukprot:35983-Eustigmatos_ZCMA.PRE.1
MLRGDFMSRSQKCDPTLPSTAPKDGDDESADDDDGNVEPTSLRHVVPAVVSVGGCDAEEPD